MKNNGNKKRFRRLMSGLMAAVMCMSLIPGAAFAKSTKVPAFDAKEFEKVASGDAICSDNDGNGYIMIHPDTDQKVEFYDTHVGGEKLQNYEFYAEMLKKGGGTNKYPSVVSDWDQLAVWIASMGMERERFVRYNPLKYMTAMELHTPKREGFLEKGGQLEVDSDGNHYVLYSSGLKLATSMKDADQKMGQFAVDTYHKFNDDHMDPWPTSELSQDSNPQPVLYSIVKAANKNFWSHGAGVGVVFSNFRLTPVFPDRGDPATAYHRRTVGTPIMDQQVFMTDSRNDTNATVVANQDVSHSASVEVNSDYTHGSEYSWEEGFEIGNEWSASVGVPFAEVSTTVSFAYNYSSSQAVTEAWSSGKAVTDEDTYSSGISVELKPYSRAMLKSGTTTETIEETWNAPVALSFKVTIVDYSQEESGGKGKRFAEVITSFPKGDGSILNEPGDARTSLRHRYAERGTFTDVDWDRMMRLSNLFHGDFLVCLDNLIERSSSRVPMSVHGEKLTSTQKVTVQESGGLISLHPMTKVVCTDEIKEYTLDKGDYFFPRNIHLEGQLGASKENAPYCSFSQRQGHWILVDKADRPIPSDSQVARLEQDPQSKEQKLVAGTQPGKVYLKYIIDEDYYALTSYVGAEFGGPITNDNIETVRIPVTIKDESKVGWKIELSGSQAIAAGDPAVAPALNVSVFNQYGREVNVPVHWYAKKLNDVVVQNDTFAAPADLKPGKYTVAAYLGSNPDAPDTYTEYTIEVKAPRTLGSMTIPEAVELDSQAQTLNLNTLEVRKFDQYKGTDLDKDVNPKAAVASADYEDDAKVVWTANNKNVTIKDGVAQFPAQNGTYTLTAACGKVKSNPVTVTVSGFVSFPDVKPNDWFYDGVMYSAQKGYFKGMPDGTFMPNGKVDRATMVQVLYAHAGRPEVKTITDKFSDVTADKWFAKAVTWAVEKGITSGVGGGKFAPNATIDRQQMAAMLKAYVGGEADVELNFVDADQIAPWATSAVKWAVANKLMGSTATDPNVLMFSPKASATRAQAAYIMMNVDKMG